MQDKLLQILKDQFKLDSFREGQEDVINSVVSKKDTLVFMPTGGGKSLTYQLPGIYLDGVCLVISPLISLMKDQVDKLNSLGIRTELINSTIDSYEKQIILNDISNPNTDIKFLYIAPERLNSSEFIRVISRVNISLVAIDEAHCISQWGHDFRPSYMKIRGFLDNLRTPPSIPPLSGEGSRTSNVLQNYIESPKYIQDLVSDLRKKQTKSEEILWEILRNKQFEGLKFRRQHPFGRYIADFYCSELKLVIELDGEIHEKTKEYDEIRDEIIEKYGVTILRFKNEEIYNNIEKILNKVLSFIPSPERGGLGRGLLFPIMALTATATDKVRTDIVKRLGLEDYNSFTAGFDRKNITIVVREIGKKDEKMEKVAEILNKTPGVGIIYCSSRKSVKEVYDGLVGNGIKAGIYTGAMTTDNRGKEQNAFMNDEYKVVVATNAFGMGIDKHDIRFVIHYNLPGSIENYYQEVGRAGRDGKKSFGIVLASFQDTKIQEFFIENANPSKEEILSLYDFLYKGEKTGEGKGKTILKTYFSIATESGIGSDMKVGSALKILEKYGILRRGVDNSVDSSDFRGRGLTLIQEKRPHSKILIDWSHQMLLKTEAYYKLDQIKKLLFFPSCRKRFILEYFGDEQDLATLGTNCGACDFCIEKKNLGATELQDFVNLSVFALVLDVVKKYDSKFGVNTITKFLRGSEDKKLIDWKMDLDDNYGSLSDLTSNLVQAVIESLISLDYLHKTDGKYPLLGLTDAGNIAITRDYLLKDDNKELQMFIKMRLGSKAVYKKDKKEKKPRGERVAKGETYNETFKLFEEGKTVDEISEIRGLKKQTIENHLVKMYSGGQISLSLIMKLVEFSNVKFIKTIINDFYSKGYEGLKDIKDKCLEQGTEVSRIEINICIAMMGKGDL